MIKLGVNIDHVATLRQARGGLYPDVLEAAKVVEASGADGITVHLREDRRHIQDRDVYALRKQVVTMLNLEMALSDGIIDIALDVVPEQVTLVPEKRQELTTEGGLNVIKEEKKIKHAASLFQEKNIIVSLFVDPDIEQIKMASNLGVDAVELHTGEYADNFNVQNVDILFEKLSAAHYQAYELGLRVNAGHGLNYLNVGRVCSLPHISELNIGHSIVSRAIFSGLENAVKEMKCCLR